MTARRDVFKLISSVPGLRARSGFTLLELIVVVAIVGVMAVAAGVALNHAPVSRAVNRMPAEVTAARRRALETGQSVQVEFLDSAGVRRDVVARPDGSVIADLQLGINRFTGRPDAPAR